MRDLLEEENPDVLCLQEVKLREQKQHHVAQFKGYVMFTTCSSTRAGYSGTRTYVRAGLAQAVLYGLDGTHHEEGRVVTVELPGFYVVNVYVPYAGLLLGRLKHRVDTWDPQFRRFVEELQRVKPVIVAGDLNVAHQDIDHYHFSFPPQPQQVAGCTQEERANFSELLQTTGVFDTFRFLYPTATGCYTFWETKGRKRTKNEGWRLDYFLLSKTLQHTLVDSYMLPHIMGSDHCPVGLWLTRPPDVTQKAELPRVSSTIVQFSAPDSDGSAGKKGGETAIGNADTSRPESHTSVVIPKRLLRPRRVYPVGKLMSVGGSRQMLMCVRVSDREGGQHTAKALVDTGAQCNLIRRGFLPSRLMSRAKEPLVLLTADHSRMAGGDEEVSLDIVFDTDVPDPSTCTLRGTFLDANINVDLILSYPWLEENEIAVYPHLGCLGVDTPARLYLTSTSARKPRRRRRPST